MSPETEEQFSKAKLNHVVATHSLHHDVLSLVATHIQCSPAYTANIGIQCNFYSFKCVPISTAVENNWDKIAGLVDPS